MICPNCGKEATGKFCPFCGTKLAEAPASQPGSAPGSASNQTQNYAPNQSYGNPGYSQNQSYGNPGYSPNQGYASNQNYAPNQGYAGNQAYTQNQNYNNPSFAYNPSRNPGYIPNQGFNPGQQVMGNYQDVPAEVAGMSPGAQLLRKHAKSPLMLIVAILVTLYAGIIGYFCVKEDIDVIDLMGNFDYLSTYVKISSITALIAYTVHIVMAIWLIVSVWTLFGSAGSIGSLKGCRAYVSFRMWVFTVLTIAALIMLVYVISDKKSMSDFMNVASQLTSNGVSHSGISALTHLLESDTAAIIIISLLFALAVVRGSLLFTASSTSARMLRYGGPLQKRMVPAGVLTLLRGLVLLAGNIYMLAEYGEHLDFEGILFFVSFLLLGLAAFFISILMFMNAAGVRRMRGL